MTDLLKGFSLMEVTASGFSCAFVKFPASKPGEPVSFERKFSGN
jgi:hypothetical protein